MNRKQVIVLSPAAYQGGCPGQPGLILKKNLDWVLSRYKEQE
jgi:hypothetical protein